MRDAVIAVVDDNFEMLELMDLILTDEGYETIPWPDGDDAYQMIRERQPDLAILDLRMGDAQAGRITLDLLRADPATADIPVLMVSADREFLAQHAALLRRYECPTLAKPFHVADFLEMVRQALEKAPAERAL
jgi:CheY-like chemotaxis protein